MQLKDEDSSLLSKQMNEVNIQFAIKQDTKRPCFSTQKVLKNKMIRTCDAVTIGELKDRMTSNLPRKKLCFFVISKLGDIIDLRDNQRIRDIVSMGWWARAATKISLTQNDQFVPQRDHSELEVLYVSVSDV